MDKKLIRGLFLATILVVGYCLEIKAEEKEFPQIYTCHQAIGRIKIDGFLNEADWKKAETIDFFLLIPDHPKVESSAFGKFLWDKTNLYIGIEAKDKDIWATFIKNDENLWEEDVLEVFFKPDKDKLSYYEFGFSPKNVFYDLFIPRRNARSLRCMKRFDSKLESAVKVYGTLDNWKDSDEKWVLEIAIPFSAFKEITPLPKVGDEWSFALCRYDYSVYLEDGRELSSTAKLSKVSFNLWEDYDKLLFEK